MVVEIVLLVMAVSSLLAVANSLPVRAGLVEIAEEWRYSNYREWLGLRKGRLKDEWFILNYVHDPSEYKKYVENAAEPEESIRDYVLIKDH